MANKNKQADEKEKERKGPSALEWAAAMVGAMLAVLILAFIGAEAVRSTDDKPPLLRAEPVSVFAEGGLYVVEIRVRNASHQTAAAVEVQGELKRVDAPVEASNATIGYVPGNSEREAGLMFSRDPRQFQLQLRVTGYEVP